MAADKYVKSSGLFGLPSLAKSVDWVLVNDSPDQATVTVTVYKGPVGTAKVELPRVQFRCSLCRGRSRTTPTVWVRGWSSSPDSPLKWLWSQPMTVCYQRGGVV